MGDYDWSMRVTFDGVTLDYVWKEYFYERDGAMESQGYWGFLSDPERQEKHSYVIPRDECGPFLGAALEFRRTQLRKEYTVEFPNTRNEKEQILDIFARSQRGEFMGQRSGNLAIYVQDIAELLDIRFVEARDLVDELVAEGKLGLNGMILIPHEDYEKSFEYLLEHTGHKRLSVSDFGYWGCQACGRHGDEYDNPSDVPCEPEKSSDDEPKGY